MILLCNFLPPSLLVDICLLYLMHIPFPICTCSVVYCTVSFISGSMATMVLKICAPLLGRCCALLSPACAHHRHVMMFVNIWVLYVIPATECRVHGWTEDVHTEVLEDVSKALSKSPFPYCVIPLELVSSTNRLPRCC